MWADSCKSGRVHACRLVGVTLRRSGVAYYRDIFFANGPELTAVQTQLDTDILFSSVADVTVHSFDRSILRVEPSTRMVVNSWAQPSRVCA